MANFFVSYFQVFLKAKPYSLYVLLLLLITFMLNQLDRFVLPITSIPTAQELEFGDKSCLKFDNASSSDGKVCSDINKFSDTIEESCNNATRDGIEICHFTYNGQGYEYQIIAGPVFILVFTVMGIVVSTFADSFSKYRTYILAASLAFWSLMTFLSGFVNSYWQLAVLRFGLGIGQAGCNPIAAGIIADYFSAELRGSALSVYNWGIYVGYSLSFAIGSQIMKALDWRWVYIICGIPGFIVAPLLIFTIKRKVQEVTPSTSTAENDQLIQVSKKENFKNVLKEFVKPSLIVLCIAGSIRNAAGFVWANNNNQYYVKMNQTPDQISAYLGVIPIVFGIIGSFLGGFVSDTVAKKAGPSMRIWVLVISQICAAPFVAGVLYFDPPYSYWFLIPTYIIGEMWIGVCLSVVVELVPEQLRVTGVGIYFFIISNIGGNMNVLVPPVQNLLKNIFDLNDLQAFRGALYVFYPGEYVLGSLLFLLSLFVLKNDIKKSKLKNSSDSLVTETIKDNEAFKDQTSDFGEDL